MTGHAVTGAVAIKTCKWCRLPVVPCTAKWCIGWGLVHLATRLHRCGNGITAAFVAGGAS